MVENLTFPFFPRLPVELQDEIWSFAAASAIHAIDSTSEVCIAAPLTPHDYRFLPSLPLTVDTSWPLLAHACRNSRAALFRSPGFTMRQHTPSQLFEDGRDEDGNVTSSSLTPKLTRSTGTIQHWGMIQWFLCPPGNEELAASIRSIAVEVGAAEQAGDLAELLVQNAPILQNLTLVLRKETLRAGEVTAFYSDALCGIPAIKRCRIRVLTLAERAEMKIRRYYRKVFMLEDYISKVNEEMKVHVTSMHVTPDPHFVPLINSAREPAGGCKPAWNESTRQFDGLNIHVGVFEEWAGTATSTVEMEQWVEPSATDPDDASRLRVFLPAEQRDPLKYRPLDDEVKDWRQ
ncbi:hypothetical protein V8F06_006681 [Rhypophila decipiens]